MDPCIAFAVSPALRSVAPPRFSTPRIARKALFSKAPPPPPSVWQQPITWAMLAVTCVGAFVVARLLRRQAKKSSSTSKQSMGDMYFQLEKSMGIQTELKQSTEPRTPRAPKPPPSAVPSPAPVPPPSLPSPVPTPAQATTPASTPPPPPTTTPPPPSAPLPTATTVPTPAPAPTPTQPPAPAEEVSKEEDMEKKGFGWLLNRGSKAGKVKPLSEVLADTEDSKIPAKFLRAVASELCVDAPGVFDGTEGLKIVPSTVPQATRSMLLHAAVKSEAESMQPKDCAEGIMMVTNSMVCKLVNRIADLKDKQEQQKELDKLILFAVSAEGLAEELAPDVEFSKPTYEGELRYKKLESLYDLYLEVAVDDIQGQTAAMMSAMMGGEDKTTASVEQMQAKAEQDEKARGVLAGIFKISEGKATKLMEKKVQVMTEKAQKDLLAGLGNLGAS